MVNEFDRDNQRKIIDLLMEYFENDLVKVCRWLKLPNPLLGGVEPLTMIAMGRSHKLLKLIQALKEENCWGKTDTVL